MRSKHRQDFFDGTKMTFGEHLEELRTALFKALLCLVIGFLFGLLLGQPVIDWLQVPVREALAEYYEQQSLHRFNRLFDERRAQKRPVPKAPDQVQQLVEKDGLLFTEVFVDPSDLVDRLKKYDPETFSRSKTPTTKSDAPIRRHDLIPILVWHSAADDVRNRVFASSVQGGFMVYLKASLVAGVVISSPLIAWFLWSFVAVGLYPHERKYVYVFLPVSLALFLMGVALAFLVVTKIVVSYFFWFNAWLNIDPDPRINEWLSFVLILPLGFGISFQLPLVMLFLERIGVFTVDIYVEKWRLAVLVIAILSMLLTPADPLSMLLMGCPLVLLYFGGILLCRQWPRKKVL